LDQSGSGREDHWFRENEKALLDTARVAREKREAERASREQAAAREELKRQHYMKCPKCGHDMKEEGFGDVEVDRCTFCEGVYFDAPELERIFLKKAEERRGLFRRLLGI
jgi:hypothetical protein